ncbi:MAG: lipase family protein [Roseivirga sp.]|nr:lipase family protein [Roseivirga sp.]
MSAPTKKEKMIWVMSDLSNINAGVFATTKEQLRINANRVKTAISSDPDISAYLPGFNVVWGVETKNEQLTVKEKVTSEEDEALEGTREVTGYATTNCMYVAKGPHPEDAGRFLYVVAIAGTNLISADGWFVEDLEVGGTMVPWPLGVSHSYQGKVSRGTADGVNALLAMRENGTGQAFVEYISGVLSSGERAEVAVCGHSLGGALAPCIAAALASYQPWTTRGNINVSCYPTAGPTPGDQDFANHVINTLGTANFTPRANTLDIVPKNWAESTMANVGTIYADQKIVEPGNEGVPESALLKGFVSWIHSLKGTNKYARIGTDIPFTAPVLTQKESDLVNAAQTFWGKAGWEAHIAINTIIEKFGGNTAYHIKYIEDLMAYAFEAGHQHTSVYGQYCFEIPANVATAIGKYISLKHLSPGATAELEAIISKLITDVYHYANQS